MRIIVTGGAGFLGQHLIGALAPSDAIVAIDNLHRVCPGNRVLHRGNVELIGGDVRDSELLTRVFRGASAVFHLAAKANVMLAAADPEYTYSTNVTGTRKVLAAAAACGVRRVVFTSSREVYGDPDLLPVSEDARLSPKNAYGASKAAAEMYCRQYSADGLQVAVVRLTNVYGPGDQDRVVPLFIERALAGQPLVLYGGDQVLDLTPVRLVVGR
jgi:UDP-glucose 4-epimerase